MAEPHSDRRRQSEESQLIRDILQFRGYTTLEAEQAQPGSRWPPRAATGVDLMDVRYPVWMGGRPKALKRTSTQKIPIIAMTAFAHEGDREATGPMASTAILPNLSIPRGAPTHRAVSGRTVLVDFRIL